MKIQPLKPLLLPAVLLASLAVIAELLPSFESFDNAVIRIVDSTPDNWEPAILLIAKIGDPLPLVLAALAVSALELYRRNYVRSVIMAGSLIAMPAFFLVKETVRRARPITEYVAQHGLQDYSFPSGHSAGTMAVYGMIAFLAYSHMKGRLRIAMVGLSVLIVIAVGFSRVYLGAHFPTDVLAGWILGFVVINLLRSLSLYLAKHSGASKSVAIEDTTEPPEILQK